MPSLNEQIAVAPVRDAVVDDCVALVDAEVKAKSGFSGAAIKTAYATVKKIKPKFVRGTVDALLDDWLTKVDPYYQSWHSNPSVSFVDYVTARSDEVGEALLTVTDERAETTKHKTAKKLYNRMRPSALRNVSAAVPKLGALIEKHLSGEQPAAEAEA